MKKLFFIGILGLFILGSCKNHSADHDHAEHDHEGHQHETEFHEQDSELHEHTSELNKHDSDLHGHGPDFHTHDSEHGTCTDEHGPSVAKTIHVGEIIFPLEKARAAGVEVSVIEPKSFRQVIRTSGQVLAAQGDETTVAANVAGVVSFMSPVTDGMSVRQGSPLLVLSSKNMVDGDPVQRAKIAYEVAKKEYDRAKGLLASKIVSEKEFLTIEQNYENARISYEAVAKHETAKGQVVTSPMNGYIKSCLVNEGDYVQVGQPLVSITQNRRLYLRADVSEKYYEYLPQISSANFKTPYNKKVYELDNLKGRVLSYGKASGTSSYYVPVTFEFDNRGDVIPGSYVEVFLLSSPMPDVLALPHTALTEEQGLFFIYLQLDKEGYMKQEVTLGADNGQEVQILSGLKAGDRVVTKGAYQVKLASATSAIPAHSHEH